MCKASSLLRKMLLTLLLQIIATNCLADDRKSPLEKCSKKYSAYNAEEFWSLYNSGVNECLYLSGVVFENIEIDDLQFKNSFLVSVKFINTDIKDFYLENVKISGAKILESQFHGSSAIKDTVIEHAELIGTNFGTIENKGGVELINIEFGCLGDPEFEIYHYPRALIALDTFPCATISKGFLLEDKNDYTSNLIIRGGKQIKTIYIDNEEFDEDFLIYLAGRHKDIGYYSEAKELIYLSKHLRVVNSILDLEYEERYFFRFDSNLERCDETYKSLKIYECEKGVSKFTKIKAMTEYYLFDKTSRYGLEPERTLYIWLQSIFFFCVIYLILSLELNTKYTEKKFK